MTTTACFLSLFLWSLLNSFRWLDKNNLEEQAGSSENGSHEDTGGSGALGRNGAAVLLGAVDGNLGADVSALESGLLDPDLGLAGAHEGVDLAEAVGGGAGAADDLDDLVRVLEAADRHLVAVALGGLVGDAEHDRVVGGALGLAEVVGVGDQDLGRLLEVVGRLLDGVLADLVEGLREHVERGRGVVLGGPERLTVGGSLAALEVLLLTLVDFFFGVRVRMVISRNSEK